MSRNLKPEYINKIRKTEAPNGYKFDIANYIYNPSYDYDYPSYQKKIDETETEDIYKRVYYFKYWDGSGEYFTETYSRKKDGSSWQVVTKITEASLEKSNRFSLKKLLSFCI